MSAPSQHRRIELSQQDLAYVYGELLAASNEKIRQHLPTSDDGDALQRQVQLMMQEFVTDAFERTKLAFLVDGRPVETMASLLAPGTEQVAPMDVALSNELRATVKKVEEETAETTRLRREAMEQLREAYADIVLQIDQTVTLAIAAIDGAGPEETALALPDAEVLAEFEHSLAQLAALKEQLPQLAAQTESHRALAALLEE